MRTVPFAIGDWEVIMIVWKKYWNLWRIKREWKELEAKRNVCVFQRFEFVELLWSHWWEYLHVGKSLPEFYVFYENGQAVCIIPIERKLKTGEISLFAGANGYCYHDFLYENCDYLRKCLAIFAEKVGGFTVTNLREKSASSSVLRLNGSIGYNCSVDIDLAQYKKTCDGYDVWFKTLSTNVRQNLRTAYNRIETDGLKWDLVVFNGGDKQVRVISPDSKTIVEDANITQMYGEILDIYCKRHESRYGVRTSGLKLWLLKNLDYSTKSYLKWDCSLTIVLRIGGRIAAFCSGYLSENEYMVPRLSFSEVMKRYSPGMLLVNEVVKYVFASERIDVFDLGLGDEEYKLKMGGKRVMIYSGKVQVIQ